ncbi:hypothetical protein [Nocardia sp. R6R-6]|uniref:hypothetical protein n=1 Tax=Nocardia sp. R6R-6 TaxID=3459303 RepID=UPI00403DBA6C
MNTSLSTLIATVKSNRRLAILGAATILALALAAVLKSTNSEDATSRLSYPPPSDRWDIGTPLEGQDLEIAQFVVDTLNLETQAVVDPNARAEWNKRVAPDYSSDLLSGRYTGGMIGRMVRVQDGPQHSSFTVEACEYNTPGKYFIEENGSLNALDFDRTPFNYLVAWTTAESASGEHPDNPRWLLWATALSGGDLKLCNSVRPTPYLRIVPTTSAGK